MATERPSTTPNASGLVRHIRGNVLQSPGRRAAVRAAVRQVPGQPRTFHAIREVAAFLPDAYDRAAEHACVAVAAMMCAQPPRGRNTDLAEGRTKTDSDSNHTTDQPQEPSADHDGHSTPTRIGSLGASCAMAVNDGAQSGSAMEARLHAICRSEAEGAHRLLPGLVSFLRGEGVPVNWMRLIDDLTWWDRRRESTAARWLREYYRGLTADQNKPSNEQESA